MKKTILSLALVAALLLTFVSCDMMPNVFEKFIGSNAENVDNNYKDTVKKENVADEEQDEDETPDDPQANVSAIVSTIKSGLKLENFVEELESAEGEWNADEAIKEASDELLKAIKDVNFSKNMTMTLKNAEENNTVTGYAGAQNGVFYVSSDGSDTYIFVEDDLKIVTVTANQYGEYEGSVEGGLYDYIEDMLGSSSVPTEPDEETEKLMQLLEKVCEIQLPDAKEKDIEYDEDSGRYYFSESYMKTAAKEIAKQILEDYYDIYEEETPDDVYEELEDEVVETIEKLNLQIWLNARSEEIVGFGYSIDVDGEDLVDEDSGEDYDIGTLKATLDVNGESVTFSASMTGKENPENRLAVDASMYCSENEFRAEIKAELDAEDTYASVMAKTAITENSLSAYAEVKITEDDASLDFRGDINNNNKTTTASLYLKSDDEGEDSDIEINITSSVTLDDEDMVEKASFDLGAKVPYSEYVYEEYDYEYASDESIILKGVTEMHMSFEMDLSRIDNGGTVSEFAFVSGVSGIKAYVESYNEDTWEYETEYSAEQTAKYSDTKETQELTFKVVSKNGGDELSATLFAKNESTLDNDFSEGEFTITLETADGSFDVSGLVEDARQEALASYEGVAVPEEDYYY